MILRFLKILLATSPLLSQAKAAELDSFPLLEYMPNGTSLTHVVIPSYDDNKVHTSVLKALEISIIDKDTGLMALTKPEVEFFSQSQGNSTIKLKSAHFHYRKNFLEGDEHITIENKSVAIEGTGVCYDMKEKKAFIKGPAQAVLLTKNSIKKIGSTSLTAMAILTASAKPPEAPSAKVLSDIAEARAEGSSNKYVQTSRENVSKQSKKVSENASKVDDEMSTFLTKANQKDVINTKPKDTRSAGHFSVPEGALKITCDDGMYYDAEEGYLVCLKNVIVSEPRFLLKCDDQLKVFLKKKKATDKSDKKASAFGNADVEQLLATGNAHITYRSDPKKPPIVATGDSAHYDVAKEEILLEGGLPTLKQGSSFFEALEPSVWIKLSPKGFLTGPGKKRTIYLTEENE